MEVSITKMSPNGQIVIPSEIRRDANIKTATKFIVYNRDGNILLEQIRKERLDKDMELMERVLKSENQIKKGKCVKVDSSMSDEDIDEILTS